MASLTNENNDGNDDKDNKNPLSMKMQHTTNPKTLEALKQRRAPPPIEIGTILLPAGIESACGILLNIYQYLDIKSLCNVKRSSLILLCRKAFGSNDFERVRDIALSLSYEGRRSIDETILSHPAKKLYLLIERYKSEFPRGTIFKAAIPTLIICACQLGRMEDVELFVNLHPLHKYITNRDLNGYRDDMTLKDMTSQVGKDTRGVECTPLMVAARREDFQMFQYLIEQGEADPNTADSERYNALHIAAHTNSTNIELIQLLLSHISLDCINMTTSTGRLTPLDKAYVYNNSPIRQEIIRLIRSKGGKANCYDANGRNVGKGNGDLND